jgi:hypothetical protein
MVIDQHKNRSQLILSLKSLVPWLFLFGLSIFSSATILLWMPKNTLGQWILAGLIYIIASTAFAFGIRWLVFTFLPARLRTYSGYWKYGMIFACLVAGMWLSLNSFFPLPPVTANPFANPYLVKLVYRASIGIELGLILLFSSIYLGTTFPRTQGMTQEISIFKSSVKYVLPTILIWLIYLLAFYPGMMSADSMNQWGQVLTGKFIDHHPAIHTFLIWLLTRLWFSPTIVAIAQILSLALVSGLWFATFEKLGIRRWVIWLGALIFAIIPVNGTMVNTLWKDIPYSTAVLGLTLVIILIVETRGTWITSFFAQLVVGVTTALVLLLRHDGAILGVGTLALLIVIFHKQGKAWLVTCLVCAFLYFGIRGPIYRLVGVEKPGTYTSSSLSLYSIAAYATQGSQTEQLVSSILLTSPSWNCTIWNEITPEMLQKDVDQSLPLMSALGNLLRRMPNLLSYDVRCARSMEWIIYDPNGEVRNASHVEALVDENPYGLQFDSKLPYLETWIAQWVYKTSHDPTLNWFIWRPAIYLYLNLFLVTVLILRNRDLRFGLISVPILIQSISFTLILAEPNFRYHYAVYLVALICLPLFFMRPLDKAQVLPGSLTGESKTA